MRSSVSLGLHARLGSYLSDCRLLGEQTSQKCVIPCLGRRWTAVQNLTPLTLSSSEKSVTVQTRSQNKKALTDISTLCLSACVDNKKWKQEWLQSINVCYKTFAVCIERVINFCSVTVKAVVVVIFWIVTQGRYNAANGHFLQAVSIQLPQTNCGSIATTTSSRVLYGIGHGHQVLARLRDYIRVATEPCLEQVLDWKDTRSDNFKSKVPMDSKWRSRHRLSLKQTICFPFSAF